MGTKGKTLSTLGVIGLLVALVTIYVVANSAQNLAQDNRDMISPHLDIHVIAGGPTELENFFKAAIGEDENAGEIRDRYVWITVLAKNKGLSEVKDITTAINLNSKIHKIYTAHSRKYWEKVRLEEKEENAAKFTVDSLSKDDSFVIFLGLQPELFEGKSPFNQRERQLWKRDYRVSFQKVEITTNGFQKVVY